MPVNTLASDWNREQASPVFRAHFRAAKDAEPALSRFADAAALVRFMRRPAESGEKDAVLCALLAWAKREPAGARLVLEAIRPGLLNMAGRLLSDSRDAEELWAIVLAATWEGIRDYPLLRRRRRVAANLLLDTMHRTLVALGRESEWRSMWVGYDRKTPAPEVVDSDVDQLLDAAVRASAISEQEAEVICASRIEGAPLADLARLAGVPYNTMKLRRQRAERRLLMFLGYRPVPRGQQNQLRRLHFTGTRTAELRLDTLYQLRVLDRFRPPAKPGTGTTPYHWIVDEAGAHVLAAHYGVERRRLKWRHANDRALADSPKLRHLIEINEFFAQLAHEARSQRGGLTEWYGERAIHGLFGGIIWPDGYGVLTLRDHEPLHFLLELDRATEPTAQLRDKAKRYAKAIPRSTLAEHHPVVILAVPTQARARAAVAAVAGTGAPITVAAWSKASPSGALAIVLESRRQERAGVRATLLTE